MQHHLIQMDDWLQQEQEYDLHYLFEPIKIVIKVFIYFTLSSICFLTPSNWTRNSVLSRLIASCSDSRRTVSNESTSSANRMINEDIIESIRSITNQ